MDESSSYIRCQVQGGLWGPGTDNVSTVDPSYVFFHRRLAGILWNESYELTAEKDPLTRAKKILAPFSGENGKGSARREKDGDFFLVDEGPAGSSPIA
jgi:hypothetical protein